MDLLITYLFFCALPLLLAWTGMVAAGLLLIRWSEQGGEPREQQTYLPPPTGGLQQVLRRWQEPAAAVGQSP
jgi:hypothetical protein